MGGSGGIRAKFRAQPLLGAFFLISTYQLGSGPIDEIWHLAVGTDLTAWAPPHVVIVTLSALALAILGSLYVAAVTRPTRVTALATLLPFAIILWTTMGVAVGDWEFTLVSGAIPAGNPFWDRPSWQYIVAGSVPGPIVFGTVGALHNRRWVSLAVAALMLVWSATAFGLFTALGSSMPQWTMPLAYLAAAFAVDVARLAAPLRGRPLALGAIFAIVETAVAIVAVAFRRGRR
jgi:hypothetical protein